MNSKIYKYTKEELQEIFDNSCSKKDVLIKLGMHPQSTKCLNNAIEKYDINLEKLIKNKKNKRNEDCHYMTKNEIGNRYGRLVVVRRGDNNKHGSAQWYCDCDCGTKDILIVGKSLRNKLTTSCGCYQKEIVSEDNKKDISENRYGKLVAIEPTDERKFGYIVWKCKCDCGNTHYVTTNSLEMGHVKSCGECVNHNSLGEEKIKSILSENGILFKTEKIFNSCYIDRKNVKLRFDFYIVDKNYLIEYDGIQHFIKDSGFGSDIDNIQKRDKFKTQWCKDNNIPLIRIPYTHYKDLCLEDLLLETSEFII